MKEALFRDGLGKESCLESQVLPYRLQWSKKIFYKKYF